MEQYPLFIKYRRDWLYGVTGYSKIYSSAARLTGISLGNKLTSPAEVLERFKFFLHELTSLIKKNV